MATKPRLFSAALAWRVAEEAARARARADSSFDGVVARRRGMLGCEVEGEAISWRVTRAWAPG